MMLPPFQGTDRGGWATGTADSLWRQADLIREFDPDALVVVSSDAVYELDYREVAEAHLGSGGEVTMVTTEVAPDDASRYGIVQVGDGDRVTDYAYKPDEPATTTATNEVFVFSPGPTLDRLEALRDDLGRGGAGGPRHPPAARPDQGRPGPGPPARRLLARRRHRRRLLGGPPGLPGRRAADRPGRPPLADPHPGRPAQRGEGRSAGPTVEQSLVSGGARVAGEVRGAVLSPGVVVEPGATVVDSVLLPGVRVRSGATVFRAVLDDGVDVGEQATVGGDGRIALVGGRSRIAPGARVAAGGRLPDPDEKD